MFCPNHLNFFSSWLVERLDLNDLVPKGVELHSQISKIKFTLNKKLL